MCVCVCVCVCVCMGGVNTHIRLPGCVLGACGMCEILSAG